MFWNFENSFSSILMRFHREVDFKVILLRKIKKSLQKSKSLIGPKIISQKNSEYKELVVVSPFKSNNGLILNLAI